MVLQCSSVGVLGKHFELKRPATILPETNALFSGIERLNNVSLPLIPVYKISAIVGQEGEHFHLLFIVVNILGFVSVHRTSPYLSIC